MRCGGEKPGRGTGGAVPGTTCPPAEYPLDNHPNSDYNAGYPYSDKMEALIGMTTADPLAAFNQLYRQMDEIYHLYAKRRGISDTALWLLYSLYEEEDAAYTQRALCSDWHYPPQTVNSALKSLERQGLLVLEPVPGNQKNKRIVLTDRGRETAQKEIFPLMLAEQRAFQGLGERDGEALLSLTRHYVELLRVQVR